MSFRNRRYSLLYVIQGKHTHTIPTDSDKVPLFSPCRYRHLCPLLLLVPRFAFQPIAAIGEYFPIVDEVERTLDAVRATTSQ